MIDGSKADCVYPEIFEFDQKVVMHMGEQPYHPANRRVTLRVKLEDLQLKYGLSDYAVMHIVTVRGSSVHCVMGPDLLIISKTDPENSPEYSEFLYLCGNHWSGCLASQPVAVLYS